MYRQDSIPDQASAPPDGPNLRSVEPIRNDDSEVTKPSGRVAHELAVRQARREADAIESGSLLGELRLTPAAEMAARPDPTYLVEGILPDVGIFQIFGAKAKYKSFLDLDMDLAIVNGASWLDHPVNQQGNVIRFLGEGSSRFGKRLNAYREAYPGRTIDGLYLIEELPISLLDPNHVHRLIELCRPLSPKKITFDAQADFMRGAEENTQNISMLMGHLRHMSFELKCAVGTIHHSGVDESRERGAARGGQAVDTQMKVSNGKIQCVKQKDDEAFPNIRFHVEKMPSANSLVVRPGLPTAQEPNTREEAIIARVRTNSGTLTKHALAVQVAKELGCSDKTITREVDRMLGMDYPVIGLHDGRLVVGH